jgi:hypothetical protein
MSFTLKLIVYTYRRQNDKVSTIVQMICVFNMLNKLIYILVVIYVSCG